MRVLGFHRGFFVFYDMNCRAFVRRVFRLLCTLKATEWDILVDAIDITGMHIYYIFIKNIYFYI